MHLGWQVSTSRPPNLNTESGRQLCLNYFQRDKLNCTASGLLKLIDTSKLQEYTKKERKLEVVATMLY